MILAQASAGIGGGVIGLVGVTGFLVGDGDDGRGPPRSPEGCRLGPDVGAGCQCQRLM